MSVTISENQVFMGNQLVLSKIFHIFLITDKMADSYFVNNFMKCTAFRITINWPNDII